MSSLIGKKGDCAGCTAIWHVLLGNQCLCSVIEDCPCLHCLIKIVCKTMCDDLNKHREKAKLWVIRNEPEI